MTNETNIEVTPSLLESLAAWGPERRVDTCAGERFVRSAVPTGQFWATWKKNRKQFYDLGISVSKDASTGEWTVNWYRKPDQVTSPQAAQLDLAIKPEVKSNGRTWSDEQKAIFAWFKTPETGQNSLVVTARAGTGKTTTIKAAFAVAPEERMLYAVFNKRNQKEASLAIDDPRVEIKTLHSLGYMFIKQVWPDARAADEVEKERVAQACGQNSPSEVRSQVRSLVGFAKNVFIDPTMEDLIELADERDIECEAYEAPCNGGWTVAKLAEAAMKVLDLSMEKDPQGRISFNDMVWLPCRMKWVRAWFDLVVVDEAQDMNVPQLMMAKGSCREGGRICVVGDDRQAIYRFRGAASDGMAMMTQLLNAAQLPLTTTYRCPKAVVALAAKLVPDYKAAPTAPEGVVERVSCVGRDIKPGDAVLSRSNAPLMPICLELLRRGIRARIEGKDIGKQLAAVVAKLNAQTVPVFMARIERWGQKQLTRFKDTKNFEQKSSEVFDTVETLKALAEGAASVAEITSRINQLFQDSEFDQDNSPKVVLSTTHKAKCGEWDKVYLLAGTFNRRRVRTSFQEVDTKALADQAKEEANIYYVALTRAKKHLVIVEQRFDH